MCLPLLILLFPPIIFLVFPGLVIIPVTIVAFFSVAALVILTLSVIIGLVVGSIIIICEKLGSLFASPPTPVVLSVPPPGRKLTRSDALMLSDALVFLQKK